MQVCSRQPSNNCISRPINSDYLPRGLRKIERNEYANHAVNFRLWTALCLISVMSTMETFKKLNDITEPDPRTHMFHIYDESLGDFRERKISDVHGRLEEITLNDNVPEAIKNHFTTSKHLVLYSWFIYRFIPVAEFHAIASLEYALKLKTGKEKWGLKRLLAYAVNKEWVRDDDFYIHRQNIEKSKVHAEQIKEYLGIEASEDTIPLGQYTSTLVESLPYLRNIYAHGSNSIAPQGYLTLIICAEFIKKIYEA